MYRRCLITSAGFVQPPPNPLRNRPPSIPSPAPAPPRDAELLVVDQVVKRYGARVAVDGLSLAVRRGETLGLLGPNGAGKTTLMSLMAGLMSPESGAIELAGHGPPSAAKVRHRIGIAPQEIALYPRMSAEENLRFFARLHGLSGGELSEGVERALRIAELRAAKARSRGRILRRYAAPPEPRCCRGALAGRRVAGRADGRRGSPVAQSHFR